MEGKPRGRATVCISEAFGFLNDPKYDENLDNGEVDIKMKKSLSVDTGMLQNKKNQNNLFNEKFIKANNETDDNFTIVAYIEQEKKVEKGRESNNLEAVNGNEDFPRVTTQDDDIPVIETCIEQSKADDDFTIVTCIENVDKCDNTSTINTTRNSRTELSPQTDNQVTVSNDTLNQNINGHCESHLTSHLEIDDAQHLDSHNGDEKSKENTDVVISEKSDSSDVPKASEDTASLRSVGTATSRSTQQIVSEAFGFLKELDDDIEDAAKINTADKKSTSSSNDDDTRQKKRSGLTRSEAFDKEPESKPGEATPVVHDHSVVKKLQEELIKGDNSRRDLETTSSGTNSTSSSSESQPGVATLRRKKNRAKQDSANQEEGSDASSDEDTGVYNESFRKSCWVRVGDNNQLSLLAMSHSQDSVSQSRDEEDVFIHSRQDDVFSEDPLTPGLKTTFHKRTESNATTTSETEFKKAYQFKKKCLVQRNDSQQEYQRLSEKFYEQEKVVVLERADTSTDLGLHILDSHPAVITTVDKDSPAEKAGVKEGQILISVNRVNVLQSSHPEIISLVQQNPTQVTLEVGTSDVHLIRDLQSTVMQGYMHQRSGSVILRTWKRRYFVLRQDNCLYCYKTDQDLLDPLGAIPLLNYTVSKNNDTSNSRPNCFKAEKYGAKTYLFSVETRDEMAQWVCAMNEAALMSKKRKDSWMDVTSHNVGLPALEIRRAECSGYLSKSNKAMRNWNKRYCVLKDACVYYYKHMNSQSAQGMAHLHGYTVDGAGIPGKSNYSFVLHPPEPQMRTFYFIAENDTDKKRWVDSMTKSVQRWIKVD